MIYSIHAEIVYLKKYESAINHRLREYVKKFNPPRFMTENTEMIFTYLIWPAYNEPKTGKHESFYEMRYCLENTFDGTPEDIGRLIDGFNEIKDMLIHRSYIKISEKENEAGEWKFHRID